jgi:hypothetical protein
MGFNLSMNTYEKNLETFISYLDFRTKICLERRRGYGRSCKGKTQTSKIKNKQITVETELPNLFFGWVKSLGLKNLPFFKIHQEVLLYIKL